MKSKTPEGSKNLAAATKKNDRLNQAKQTSEEVIKE